MSEHIKPGPHLFRNRNNSQEMKPSAPEVPNDATEGRTTDHITPAEFAADVLQRVKSGDVEQVIEAIDPGGVVGVGIVKFYNPEKGFGFATLDGEDVFFSGRGQRLYRDDGLNVPSDPASTWGDSDELVQPKHGEKIVIDSIDVPERALKKGQGKRQNPQVLGWGRASEYLDAARSIYERPAVVPGMYFSAESGAIGKAPTPWSKPSTVTYLHRDKPLDYMLIVGPGEESAGPLNDAKKYGLVAGADQFRAFTEDMIAKYETEIQEFEEEHDKYRQMKVVVGDLSGDSGEIQIGEHTIIVQDGFLPVKYGQAPTPYYDKYQDDWHTAKIVMEIGGISLGEVSPGLWNVLKSMKKLAEEQGAEALTEEVIRESLGTANLSQVLYRHNMVERIRQNAKQVLEGDHEPFPGYDVANRERGTHDIDWKKDLAKFRESRRQLKLAETAKKLAEEEALRQKEIDERQSREDRLGKGLEAKLAEYNVLIQEAIGRGVVMSEVTFGDTYFKWGYKDMLYTEDNVQETIESIIYNIERQESALALKDMQSRFSEVATGLEGADVEVVYRDAQVEMIIRGKTHADYEQFTYDEDGLQAFMGRCSELKRIATEATHQATEKQRLDAEGREAGLPSNVAIWRRAGGATNRGDGWVVRADGSLRAPDKVPVRYGKETDGNIVWEQIHVGELALSWHKNSVVDFHNFSVVHMPDEGLTEEQLTAVRKLQEEIADDWSIYDDRQYDPRGDRSSPPVGEGWGLIKHGEDDYDEPMLDDGDDSREVTEGDLEALLGKFKKH